MQTVDALCQICGKDFRWITGTFQFCPTCRRKVYDMQDKIRAYDMGYLNLEDTVKLFQELCDTGIIDVLAGRLQVEALKMIDAGLIKR